MKEQLPHSQPLVQRICQILESKIESEPLSFPPHANDIPPIKTTVLDQVYTLLEKPRPVKLPHEARIYTYSDNSSRFELLLEQLYEPKKKAKPPQKNVPKKPYEPPIKQKIPDTSPRYPISYPMPMDRETYLKNLEQVRKYIRNHRDDKEHVQEFWNVWEKRFPVPVSKAVKKKRKEVEKYIFQIIGIEPTTSEITRKRSLFTRVFSRK
ncbi:hypothetical protein HGA88_02380 [Candidatus Roizmanbacteria bacterium]|nr:hypothetical protein [Candidatus Roizmanbacteria bacterium]